MRSPIEPAPRPAWQYGSLLLVVVAVLLLSRPYTGVRHDGILYAGEALARLLPGQFSDDSYFRFGSQGRFTLLPAVYAALISAFGIGNGTIVGLLVALAAYVAASAYLVSCIAPRRHLAVCLLSLVLGWTIYGGQRVFAYSEGFLTARSFAEPAVLLGLGLLLRGRRVAAAIALFAALAIHPLIAIGGIAVAWLWLARHDRRWLAVGGLGLVVLVALGVARVGPFADVFARYDAVWLELVEAYNPQAFVLRWSLADYGMIVFNVCVLRLAMRAIDDASVRRFVLAAVVAGIGATVVSFVAVDLASNPFFGKLQVWRAEWVMQWLAMAILPVVLAALWARGESGRVAACFVGLGWIAPFSYAPAVLGVMAVVLDAMNGRVTITRTTTRIVVGVVVVAALTLVGQYELRAWRLGHLLDQSWMQILAHAVGMNLVLLAIAFAFVRAMPRLGRAAPVIALVLVAGALSLWDQRTPWTKTLESYKPGTPLWAGLIERDAKVYWYRDLIAPWVLLGHGNYYTAQQGSGAVFSREMTLELDKRSKLTGLLDMQEQICRMMNSLNAKESSCEPDALAVSQVCKEGGIDYVVLQSRLDGAKPVAEKRTGVIEEGYEKRFFLYRCSTLVPTIIR